MMTKPRILFCLCVLVMAVSFVMLGFREDGERLALADHSGNATLEIEPDSVVSMFVCLNENEETDPPESLVFVRGNEFIPQELTGPRPLELPLSIAARNNISMRQKCSVSTPFKTSSAINDTNEVFVKTAENAFVIAAVSSQKNSTLPLILFLSFLAMILTGIGIESLKPIKNQVIYKRYDGVIGFVLGLILAFVIAYVATLALPPEDTLFPGYGEMMIMVAANFVAFLATYIGISAIRWRKQTKALAPNAKASEETGENTDNTNESTSELPKFNPWISLCAGPGLAILAAIFVSFAPLPGLSTLEMASQLTSTLFMSAFFAILAGIGEECLFRGLIQSSFEARDNSRHPMVENTFAITVATTLFVALHVPQSLDHLWALIPIGLISITSGLLKIRYKSLYPCILLHMSYNATLLLPSILV